MSQSDRFASLKVLGERPSIDFVNTVDWRGKQDSLDYLTEFDDLLDWAKLVGLIDEEEHVEVSRAAISYPENAFLMYKRMIDFRENLYGILLSKSGKEPIDEELEANYQSEIKSMLKHLSMNIMEGRLELDKELDVGYVLRILVKDSVDLISSDDVSRVKRCGSEECGWLFIDTSKNSSRKWCQMRGCGNRAKARRFYSRSKQ